MTSYDVRFWDIRKIGDTARGRYRVRWAVGGREHCKSFTAKALADAFLGTLRQAARDGTPFSPATGQPAAAAAAARPGSVTWYEHARAYSQMKWPDLAAKSRRSVAEALTTITLALAEPGPRPPEPALLRHALLCYAFNHASPGRPAPAPVARALDWAASTSPPVAALDDPGTIRAILTACARRLDGMPAAAATSRRKRAVLASALGFAVERRLLPASPLTRVKWKAAEVAQAVDRRSVASPGQVALLLDAVRAQGPRGEHMEAFFGCLYYAALRPEEAVTLRRADLILPPRGWGTLILTAACPRTAATWTTTGTAHELRGLKHRPHAAVRVVPIPPQLVALLRWHLDRYATTLDGRLFRGARGGILSESTYGRAWHAARDAALGPALTATPLARRPYDLRHAALSLWLNATADPARVAARAGNSARVLHDVCTHCVSGRDDIANEQIGRALSGHDLPRQAKASGPPHRPYRRLPVR